MKKRGRAGLATHNANTDKHPGLVALDEEDLKARRKKDHAVAKKQASAKQKKELEQRLIVGTKKIAAHEDQMFSRLEENSQYAASPRPGPITQKTPRPVAPVQEETVDHADVKSNAYSDFTLPPDSDTPSDSDDSDKDSEPGDDMVSSRSSQEYDAERSSARILTVKRSTRNPERICRHIPIKKNMNVVAFEP